MWTGDPRDWTIHHNPSTSRTTCRSGRSSGRRSEPDDPLGELRRHFRPEFLNRIDEVVLFKPLTPAQIEQIVGQLFLGENLDAENLSATYDRGMLILTIPVAEQAKPRRIDIQGGAAAIGLGLAAMIASCPRHRLGVTDPRTWDAPSWISDLLPHLAYGLVTALAYDAVAGSSEPA
jgi:hypothetical protein